MFLLVFAFTTVRIEKVEILFSAGDFVKFGFTMASATTLLAWGAISWPEAYTAAGQLDELRKAIKWATDYFIKCHVSEYVFYGQVGEFFLDHTFWGRPEELNTTRPAYKIDPEHPGIIYILPLRYNYRKRVFNKK